MGKRASGTPRACFAEGIIRGAGRVNGGSEGDGIGSDRPRGPTCRAPRWPHSGRRLPAVASSSHRTLRWREAGSNFQFRDKNSQRLGSRSTNGAGSTGPTQGRPAGIVDVGRTSDHQLARDTAYIHLEIEPLHRRAREMPRQTARDGSAADELVGHEWMDVKDRIDLGRGHIRPAEAERRHPLLHRPEHETRFLAHRLGRLVAAPNDAPFIAGAALARFAASRGDKAARRAIRARDGVAEGVERRRCGRVDFRADVRAGNRVDLVAENPPGGQPLDIMIERNETGVGELRRGAQLAGAERGGRASDAGKVGFDRIKTYPAAGRVTKPPEAWK